MKREQRLSYSLNVRRILEAAILKMASALYHLHDLRGERQGKAYGDCGRYLAHSDQIPNKVPVPALGPAMWSRGEHSTEDGAYSGACSWNRGSYESRKQQEPTGSCLYFSGCPVPGAQAAAPAERSTPINPNSLKTSS